MEEIILNDNYFLEDDINFSDEEAYKVKTDKGIYYIYEKDYIEGWKVIKQDIRAIPHINKFLFIESKQEKKEFTEYTLAMLAMYAKIPNDFKKLQRYWAEISGVYFYFLVKQIKGA